MVSDLSLAGALPTQSNLDATTLAEDFDQFLTLLTVQLQNQDPLDPLDSNEFTNQLVQFTQAEQLINQNQKLDQLIGFQSSNATSAALGFVGLEISYLGNRVYSDGTLPQDINYGLNEPASEVNVIIRDSLGQAVRTIEGPIAGGSQQVTWDGLDDNGNPVEPGIYDIEIAALDQLGEPLPTSLAVTGIVTGIENTQGRIDLILQGDLGLPIGNVLAAELPPTPVVADTDSGDGSDSSDGTDDSNGDDNSDDGSAG